MPLSLLLLLWAPSQLISLEVTNEFIQGDCFYILPSWIAVTLAYHDRGKNLKIFLTSSSMVKDFPNDFNSFVIWVKRVYMSITVSRSPISNSSYFLISNSMRDCLPDSFLHEPLGEHPICLWVTRTQRCEYTHLDQDQNTRVFLALAFFSTSCNLCH